MQPTTEFYSKVQVRGGSVLILIPADVYRKTNLNIGDDVKVIVEAKPREETPLEEIKYGVAANVTRTVAVSDVQEGKSLQPAPQDITQYGTPTNSTRNTPTSTNAEIEHEDIYLQQVVMF